MVAHLSWYQFGHFIDNLNTCLLQCPCENECTIAHNTLWNIVAPIVLEGGAHVQREVSHLFPHHT
jgi:hypothetical protein